MGIIDWRDPGGFRRIFLADKFVKIEFQK